MPSLGQLPGTWPGESASCGAWGSEQHPLSQGTPWKHYQKQAEWKEPRQNRGSDSRENQQSQRLPKIAVCAALASHQALPEPTSAKRLRAGTGKEALAPQP